MPNRLARSRTTTTRKFTLYHCFHSFLLYFHRRVLISICIHLIHTHIAFRSSYWIDIGWSVSCKCSIGPVVIEKFDLGRSVRKQPTCQTREDAWTKVVVQMYLMPNMLDFCSLCQTPPPPPPPPACQLSMGGGSRIKSQSYDLMPGRPSPKKPTPPRPLSWTGPIPAYKLQYQSS